MDKLDKLKAYLEAISATLDRVYGHLALTQDRRSAYKHEGYIKGRAEGFAAGFEKGLAEGFEEGKLFISKEEYQKWLSQAKDQSPPVS